jgi:Fe-S-cluster-containing dehydrogenase component/CRP-like cAMP-binding protein
MIDKEKWWGPRMTEQDIKNILACEIFNKIDQDKFPSSRSLESIICEHTRLVDFKVGEVVVRAGDYGNSAFLIIDGNVDIILPTNSSDKIFGHPVSQPTNWFKEIAKLWKNSVYPEVRDYQNNASNTLDIQVDHDRHRVFIKNYSKIIEQLKKSVIRRTSGDITGEIAALSRSPRTAHIIASTDSQLLEIRWQGLHTLRKFNDEFRQKVDMLYRKNSLDALRILPLFSNLEKHEQDQVIEHSLFESYGEFSWQDDYKKDVEQESSDLLKNETLIVAEGDYADGLLFIRSGIARVSNKYNHGHRVLKYLNKGDTFGLEVMIHNWKNKDSIPLATSLYAVGYTDVLRVPYHIIEQFVLPKMSSSEIDKNLLELETISSENKDYAKDLRISDGMLDFMSDYRYINGSASMLIDLDRCIRCDDCVNACAVGHNNNPRFNRHGRRYDHFMVANACMHCHDPVCMIGCPTGAIHREPSGQIAINDDTCIGCSTCANSCPYDNIRMISARDEMGEFMTDEMSQKPVIKATKCDLCVDQIGGPACVRACPHDALTRIDFLALSTLIDKWDQ